MELEQMKQLIARVIGEDPQEITEETTFFGDLDIDSLDAYQIILEIQDTFGIQITDQQVEALQTVGDVVALIREETK